MAQATRGRPPSSGASGGGRGPAGVSEGGGPSFGLLVALRAAGLGIRREGAADAASRRLLGAGCKMKKASVLSLCFPARPPASTAPPRGL